MCGLAVGVDDLGDQHDHVFSEFCVDHLDFYVACETFVFWL